jgi:hypothetical protein
VLTICVLESQTFIQVHSDSKSTREKDRRHELLFEPLLPGPVVLMGAMNRGGRLGGWIRSKWLGETFGKPCISAAICRDMGERKLTFCVVRIELS